MRKYYQLLLVIVCIVCVIALLIYRHEYYRLRYVLEVLNFFGKPGLSEVEFCGPGFNASMLSEILKNSSMEARDRPPIFQQIDEDFYAYSSFLHTNQKYNKLSPSSAYVIDTIVMGKVGIVPTFRCNIWMHTHGIPKAGRFSYKKLQKENDEEYLLYLFQCSLSKDLGKPNAVSFYKNNVNVNPFHAPIHSLVAVNPQRKSKDSIGINFISNVEVSLCVIPNRIPFVTRKSIIDFLVFYRMMGVKDFTFYDTSISEDIMRRIRLLPSDLTDWDINFFPLNFPFIFSKSYEMVRRIVEIDCTYRHFQTDKDLNKKISHVITLSWDEFIVPRYSENIRDVLDDFDPTKKLDKVIVATLVFCTNQLDDENVHEGFPTMVKKTHFYDIDDKPKNIYIRNVDKFNTIKDVTKEDDNSKLIGQELLAVHKYTECGDGKMYWPGKYNESQLQLIPHKFEGAILKFGKSMVNNKIYRFYASGQIWERSPNERVRDL